MRRGKTKKARFAAALALVMAVTMTAPALPAYALPNVPVTKVNHTDHSEIWFDTGIGPGLEHSEYGYAAAVSSDKIEKKTIDGEPVFVFAGKAGVNLTDQSSTFQGIELEEARQGANRGQGTVLRPKLPGFDLGENGWPGYTFDGWYEKNRKVDNLPPQFYYETPTIYTAKWKRDSNQTFQLTVMHYRDLDAARNEKHEEDPAAWIQDSNAESIHAFNMQGNSWSKEKSAEDLITDTYRRDIPGYQFQNAMIKNNRFRRYGEASGQGTVHPAAAELNDSNNLKGSMPNDNLTVAYRYKPNEDQKFSFRVEYRDMTGAAIKKPEITSCAAETKIQAEPVKIKPYVFKSAKWVIAPEASDPARGVYSAKEAGCTLDPDTGAFRGTMPNQRVTICYQYAVDPNFKSRVHVTYLDNHEDLMTNIPGGSVQDHSFPLGLQTIPAPKIAGYQYPPTIEILPGGQISKGNPVGLTEQDPVYRFSLGTAGGMIKVHYLENLNDTACWARISYVKEGHGAIAGKLAPRSFRTGEQTLDALTEGITVQADPHYEFDGWYQVDPRNPAGRQKLNQTIRLDRNLQLIATFKKKREDWFRLQFRAGANGRLLENQSVEVERGTKWRDVRKPETESTNALYQFAGWYDQMGNKMEDPDAEIEADQTYTARFSNPNGGTADDPLLAIPDASGAVLRDGSGEVAVHSPNENRRYALTDSEGTVLSVKTGSELVNGRFTGLPVCSQYLVYELELRVNSGKGAKISELDQGNRSQPASVVVPALGENYRVEDDRAADQKKITVNPAAPDTRYALLDAGGEVVSSWKMPEGTSQTVVFAGLAPNTVYTVVAKSASGTEEPSQKQPMGCLLYTSPSPRDRG